MESVTSFLGYKPANLLVPFFLFLLLSPGMLVTFPSKDVSGRFLSEQTSRVSVLVHALLFLIVYFLLRKFFSDFY